MGTPRRTTPLARILLERAKRGGTFPHASGKFYHDNWIIRHGRRLCGNAAEMQLMEEFCAKEGITFIHSNGTHHWRFKIAGRHADWWPSSAKLILDKEWLHELHTHTIEQACFWLKQWADDANKDLKLNTPQEYRHP